MAVEQDRQNGLCGAGVVDHLVGKKHLAGICAGVNSSLILFMTPFEQEYQAVHRPAHSNTQTIEAWDAHLQPRSVHLLLQEAQHADMHARMLCACMQSLVLQAGVCVRTRHTCQRGKHRHACTHMYPHACCLHVDAFHCRHTQEEQLQHTDNRM